ncbi:MAG: DUF1614 domain-containing protein [Gammaproteobacteria bacterium]|nr:DUF1614 domain-containing protein [Gammaproteobacteria bacterium]
MQLLYLIILSFFLIVTLQLGIFSIVLTKLGLSPESAGLLFAATLIGSMINLPLFSINSTSSSIPENYRVPRSWLNPFTVYNGKIIIALNVGGALIPICFSIYLISLHSINYLQLIPAVGIVTAVSYFFSRPIEGFGIGMPIFVAPLTAAMAALIINPENSASLAYICGTLGVLIGADLLRLKDIRHMAVPVASIGGAGTFDGIFFTGIIAVLLT